MRFARVWAKPRGCVDGSLCDRQARRRMIIAARVDPRVRLGELTIRQENGRVSRDSLIQKIRRLEQVIPLRVIAKGRSDNKTFSTCVQIIGKNVLGWSLLNGQCFTGRNIGPKLICYRLRQLSLNGKHVL